MRIDQKHARVLPGGELELAAAVEVAGQWIRAGVFYGEAPGSHMAGKHAAFWRTRMQWGPGHPLTGWNLRAGWWPRPCVTLLLHTRRVRSVWEQATAETGTGSGVRWHDVPLHAPPRPGPPLGGCSCPTPIPTRRRPPAAPRNSRVTADVLALASKQVSAARRELGLTHTGFARYLTGVLGWAPTAADTERWERTPPPADVLLAASLICAGRA